MLITVLERLIIFVLLVWGVTNIISGSMIMKPFRDLLYNLSPTLGKLISCYMCTGFWVGISISFWCVGTIYPNSIIAGPVLDGFIGSGTTWIIFVILEKLGARNL